MTLNELWFALIAVLWIGYFALEGFDFGVGMLLPPVGRTPRGRRVLINTIGPVWDGNEVWLITAAGAMFAAFPLWYATLFSGAYLPLLVILLCLIVRGVAFEYRGKGSTSQWRRNWDIAITVCSLLPSILWGIIFGSIIRGVPLDAEHEFTGSLGDYFAPFSLLTGLLTFLLFAFHGAVFLRLKTTGEVRARALRVALPTGMLGAVAYLAMVIWMQTFRDGIGGMQLGATSLVVGLVGVVAMAAGVVLAKAGRDGWAFTATAASVVAWATSIFTALYPMVMPSSSDPAGTLTLVNAASGHYTLKVMSWVALFLVPFVLAYQAWTYWVFRKRISTKQIPPTPGEAQDHHPDDDPIDPTDPSGPNRSERSTSGAGAASSGGS
ncbi:cytochrome d ubiquinol oxidase subunit II [Nakamurella aerolata]|uniref:Cytochrome d ubiquinol oxidase subunit II n=1 Tax=Nakamurella aerolata TaxID=1656892 RepID=A0A849A8C8_9ACTN|nr:cytochrome d ubiquinol oxidase subunit II [Nakamurella aerolata]NNG37224.1 cytochrome d ubiquinol oxidase subunit II [Nakamurella aerolata]